MVTPFFVPSARRPIARQPAGGWQEAAIGIFGIDPRFDRPAVPLHIFLRERQFLARGAADHQFDQVEPGDQFRHRMLDLQARIHFQEIEIARAIDDELDRAGAVITHGLGQRDRLRAHGGAGLFVQEGRWRFLDHFLVAALDGTFALVQMNDIAVLVGDQLDFDMARLGDEFLHQQAAIAEAGLGFVAGRQDRLRQLLLALTTRRPLPPPPADALTITG